MTTDAETAAALPMLLSGSANAEGRHAMGDKGGKKGKKGGKKGKR